MAPIEAVDPKWMRAVFPEAPTGALEAVSGKVDLIMGYDNYRLFPLEFKRVQDAMLLRSRFGTGWIACGRPPGQGDPATSAEGATCTGEANRSTSAEEATCTKEAARAEGATCIETTTGTEEEPARIASMEKPAKPPDRLDEQFAITNVVLVQQQEELEEQGELDMQEEGMVWDEGPSDEDDRPMPDCVNWSHGYGAEDTECIPEQAEPPARICASIGVPAEQKTGQQARVAGIREQLTSLLAQPKEEWLSTAPAARNGRLTMSGISAGGTAAATDWLKAPLPEEPMPIMAEVRAPRPAELLELQVQSQWILGVGAATSRDQAQGATGSVAQYELQPGKTAAVASTQGQKEAGEEQLPERGSPVGVHRALPQEEAGEERLPERGSPVGVQRALPQEEAGEERLPERGSPVGVQWALPQEGAAREAGAEQLPEQGGPVEVQLKLCQEGSWAKAKRGQRIVGQRPGGGRRPRWKGPAAKQVVVMRGSRRVAGKATSAQQGLLHLGKRGMIFVGEVKDEGDEDDPQCEIRSQAGHPVPVGHENCRRRIWEPGKPHSELRQ
jgi:hypothetical protein